MKYLRKSSVGKNILLASLLSVVLAACSGEKPETMVASARDFMAKNDLKSVVIQAKNALQQNPDLPEARYLLGLALLRSGDPVGAETELRKAQALKHPDDDVVPPLVEAMLVQGKARKVVEEFAKTELSNPAAKAALQTSLYGAYAASGSGDKAKVALETALAVDPEFLPAKLLSTRELAVKGDIDGAMASVNAILAKSPTSHEALAFKGDLLAGGKGDRDGAMAAYRKAAEIKPDYAPAQVAILKLLMGQGKLDEATKQMEVVRKLGANSPQVKYYETLLAFQKKDFTLAKELSPQMLKVAPNSVQVLTLAGAIELQNNSLLQAENYLSKVVQGAPQVVYARRLLVSTYLRSGQADKALVTLQPLLKEANVDAAVNAIAGEVYLQNGDLKNAEEYFAKASKQNPQNARSRTALALTHMAAGKDGGLEELLDVAASDSGATADLALISVHLRRNELDKALKAIDGLEKKQPGKPLAANLRGRTLLAKKDIAGARKSFERSLEIDPAFFPSVAALAALDLADKKPDLARKRFEDVLAKNPKHSQALLALAELRSRAGGPKDEVAELITKAVTANPTEKAPRLLLVEFHLRNKDFKLALSAAQNAVATLPDSPELLDALGRALQLSGDGNQALATFSKLAIMQPRSPLPYMRMADVNLTVMKDKLAAVQNLRKALEVKPDVLEAQRGLMLLALDSKNYKEALGITRDIQKQRPKEAIGYSLEGDIAANQKKWDVAADAYRVGLKAVDAPELAVKLYSALGAAEKSADQERFAAGWLKEHPKDVVMRLFLGDVSLARNDLEGAERNYLDVIRIEPRSAVAFNNLAWVTGRLKKDGAIEYAEKALVLGPNQPAFMDTLAMLLSEKGDYAKALELQTKVLALQPDHLGFKLNLAKIHVKGGKKDLARKELDDLAKLGDKFPAQAEVAVLLKSL